MTECDVLFKFIFLKKACGRNRRKELNTFLTDNYTRYQGGESKGKFFMEQAKMTPRKELCESKVSVLSFLPCY